MKQFLRFQISGLTCILWTILFLLPYINWSTFSTVNFEKLVVALVGSFAVALPLGTVIHQISISLLSPFRKERFFIKILVIDELKILKDKMTSFNNSDEKYQSILVFYQGINVKWTTKENMEKTLDVEHIRNEISNRYSYYYVRIDNGIIAPVIGFFLFLLINFCADKANVGITLQNPIIPSIIMPLIALIFCYLIVKYVPELLKDIDDIERLLLKFEDNIVNDSLRQSSHDP